jgi:excisionase family DNA binding protein
MKSKYLRPAEVALLLDVQKSTVWRWARKGILPVLRIGKRYYIDAEELSVFLSRRDSKRILREARQARAD